MIFDWDDTLYPTTAWTHNNELRNASALELLRFGKSMYDVLSVYMQLFGAENLFIVTNAVQEWVFKSLRDCSAMYRRKTRGNEILSNADYFAAIYNSLVSSDILICSAKDLHSKDYPQQIVIWKTLVFKHIMRRHFNLYSGSDNNVYSIVSIGDSEAEFTASFEAKNMLEAQNKLNRNNNVVRLHRIKLRKQPKVQQMMEQIAMLIRESEALRDQQSSITVIVGDQIQENKQKKEK